MKTGLHKRGVNFNLNIFPSDSARGPFTVRASEFIVLSFCRYFSGFRGASERTRRACTHAPYSYASSRLFFVAHFCFFPRRLFSSLPPFPPFISRRALSCLLDVSFFPRPPSLPFHLYAFFRSFGLFFMLFSGRAHSASRRSLSFFGFPERTTSSLSLARALTASATIYIVASRPAEIVDIDRPLRPPMYPRVCMCPASLLKSS